MLELGMETFEKEIHTNLIGKILNLKTLEVSIAEYANSIGY